MRRRMVAASLLAEILQGSLRAGQHLVIKELSVRYHVSSTPIREALVQLEGIGILDFVPNSGAVVRRVTTTDVKEVCQVRRALECEATRRACGRIDLAELHELAAAFRRMKNTKRREASFVDTARQLDSKLHDLIAESCGNRFLAQEIGRLKLLFRAFRDASWEKRSADVDRYRFSEEADEHLAIILALIAGDARQASRAMARHIRAGVKYWSRGLPT
jgi:DNA-binding GntR family transcriptional regulator